MQVPADCAQIVHAWWAAQMAHNSRTPWWSMIVHNDFSYNHHKLLHPDVLKQCILK
jgi:hypothetical protein